MADFDDKALDALLEKHMPCTDSDVIEELVEALREARAERPFLLHGHGIAYWYEAATMAEAQIAAVRALHVTIVHLMGRGDANGLPIHKCEACGKLAPCPTIRALDGDGATKGEGSDGV